VFRNKHAEKRINRSLKRIEIISEQNRAEPHGWLNTETLKTRVGESGLNWLCAGLKAFFAHTERPMREMADLLKSGRYADEIMIRKPEEALATPR
jgi:sulfatase maturation enzyme AslB (radical SAM superfamily)